MKTLLNNRFAPVTFSWGLLETSIDALVEFQRQWAASRSQVRELHLFRANLADALLKLEPLNSFTVLYVATRSAWTAVFQACLGSESPYSEVSYPAEAMSCRGVLITWAPDTYDERTGKGLYGGTGFQLFAPHRTDFLNHERAIMAVHDTSGWVFQLNGRQQPFEEPHHYTKRRIRDRLTPEMLDRYCRAIGIRPFEEEFYREDCALIGWPEGDWPRSPNTTYEGVQRSLGFRPA